MSKMRFKNTKAGGFFTTKGFYIALAVCLIAIGGATWTAINTIGNSPDPLDFPDSDFYAMGSSSEESTYVVDIPVSDIPMSSSSSGETSSEPDIDTAVRPEDEKTESSKETKPDTEYYVMPVDNGQVQKNYNSEELQFSKTFNDWRAHLGIDIKAEKGTRVVTAANGTVSEVYNDQLMGNTVVIEHANGVVGYYSGLDSIKVKKGDEVKASDEIGEVGTVPCEALDDPHMHFAMKKDGVWVSPLQIMGMTD